MVDVGGFPLHQRDFFDTINNGHTYMCSRWGGHTTFSFVVIKAILLPRLFFDMIPGSTYSALLLLFLFCFNDCLAFLVAMVQ